MHLGVDSLWFQLESALPPVLTAWSDALMRRFWSLDLEGAITDRYDETSDRASVLRDVRSATCARLRARSRADLRAQPCRSERARADEAIADSVRLRDADRHLQLEVELM